MFKLPKKLCPHKGAVSPITRLKALPRKALDRIWAWHEDPTLSNADVRRRIARAFRVQLGSDCQMSSFWRWQAQARSLEDWGARADAFQAWYQRQNPELSHERCRAAAIDFFMSDAACQKQLRNFIAIGDFDLRLQRVLSDAELKDRKLRVEEDRLKLLKDEAARRNSENQPDPAPDKPKLTKEERDLAFLQVLGRA